MPDDLLCARLCMIAAEGRYYAAKRGHRAYADLHKAWVKAKARVAALEGQG